MLPGAVPVPIPPVRPGVPSQAVAPMPYGQVAYGYMAVPPLQALMGMPPPGMPQYSVPYPAMIRPGFPPHPIPPTGVIPQLPRPPIPGICGMPPVVTPLIRPVAPIAEPTEKPQTTVYVGKIAATVENEFLLSILKLCGPVKSWKRAQDPSDGTPKGFGFCEFESAEGVLRSLRLLSKLNIDGQVLVLNINEATRKYLEQYVEKKTEREKLKETETGDPEKEKDSKEAYVKPEPMKPVEEETKKDSEVSGDKENQEINKKFGIVTDEDHEADRDALEKLTNIIEERLKNKPLPAPLPVQIPVDGSAKSTSEVPSKSRNRDFNVDIMRNDAAEDKNDEETTNENKSVTENVVPETGSPGKARRHDSKSRGQDRERNLKREKERELERAERERERKRVRWERERELKLREAEWLYKDRLKEWEAREREKEYRQRYEREWEKERERERQKEILQQEEESSDDDNDSRKRRRRSGIPEEKRRKRKQEKEEDLDDRLKEEEEIAEAKRKEVEEQQLKPDPKSLSRVTFEYGRPFVQEEVQFIEFKQNVSDQAYEASGNDLSNYGMSGNGNADDHNMAPIATSDTKQNNNAPAQKLEFSLIGSGKQMTVPSVFHEENDEDVDEKKMRPLVPIDYSTKELQAVQTNASGPQPNLTAADEFAKGISSVNPKEEKPDVHRERNRHFNEKLNLKERDQNDGESSCSKDESKERMHEMNVYREKDQEDGIKTENNKFLDAKQLINMIPKTKEELFVYEINWGIFDEHQLHAKMRPWISKKTTEFLGEEEATLVDYIVSCIKDHIQASTMLEMLQSILDDEAEMFVLKMWRMLIFEIKRVETGFSVIPRS